MSAKSDEISNVAIRIGIFGPYHSRNLGDTATQMAVIHNLKSRLPNAVFLGICLDPRDSARTHGIDSIDMTGQSIRIFRANASQHDQDLDSALTLPGKSLWPRSMCDIASRVRSAVNIFRAAGKIDILIVSGGGQIDDFWGGPWGRPFELLMWALACRLRGRKVAAFGTGLDNLYTRLGRFMAFSSMRMAHYRLFRDHETARALHRMGIRTNVSVAPDPAFSLTVVKPADVHLSRQRRPVVLVCPIASSAWMATSNRAYEHYRSALVDACVSLLARGMEVRLSNSQSGMDVPLVHELASRIRDHRGIGVNQPIVSIASTVNEYCEFALEADLVIASRLHGVILPIVVGTPVVAISYMSKVRLMMVDAGMPDRCLDLLNCSSKDITDAALGILASSRELRTHIQSLNSRARRLLDDKFDELAKMAVPV